MANPTIAPSAPAQAAKSVTSATPAKVILPEAFQPQTEPASPAPEMDAFAELEQIDANNPSPDSRPPRKAPDASRQADKPAAKAEPKAQDKPAEKAVKPTDKPKDEPKAQEPAEGDKKPAESDPLAPDDPSRKFQLASELRKDYRRIHTELERLTSENKQLRNGKPADAPEERKALDTKLSTLEKRNKELEEEISYRDYTKSSDFEEKFKKPFETKLARIYRQVSDLYVRDAEGNERAATREDFDRVLEAPQSDARRIAKEVFGDEDFREVLQYRRELNELQQNADAETKSWREKAKEREQNNNLEQRRQVEQAQESFRKLTDGYVERFGEWFGDIEGDDELNTALKQGFASVDASQDNSLPVEKRLDLLAAGRLKAAAFPRNVVTIKRLKAKVAELEESLKAFQKSEPGEGQGQRTAAVGKSTDDEIGDANDEIDRLERRNPVPR